MKVVINNCYGGFGLSKEAVMRYAELAGITLYHDRDSLCDHYYKIPAEEYKRLYAEHNYQAIDGMYFHDSSIKRNDPLLVQVVEELGRKSWGDYTKLRVVEIPDDVQWEIHEYDGMETIAEAHRTWS